MSTFVDLEGLLVDNQIMVSTLVDNISAILQSEITEGL